MTRNSIYWSNLDNSANPPRGREPLYHELRNLWVFVRENSTEDVEEFLKRFPNTVRAPITATDYDEGAPGDQAIHIAAHRGHPDMIDFLISKGAGIEDANTQSGKTPLIAAAMSNKKRIIEHLLKKGANIEARDNDGRTALWHAASCGYNEPAVTLLLAHADIEARNNGRKTPLLAAIEEHNDGMAILLLQHGAKTHVSDKDGNTPFSLLLARGAENATGLRMRELLFQRSAEEQEGARLVLEKQRQELMDEITNAACTPVDMRGKTMAPLRLTR